MSVIATAPSNIALIKYMGKTQAQGNRPANVSLSYTLEHLRTTVTLTHQPDQSLDHWSPLGVSDCEPFSLSQKGQMRFLDHFRYLKTELGLTGNYQVLSGNNFPSDCGLASSASSFAALTKAAYLESRSSKSSELNPDELKRLSSWSRKGSGSSCRSFFSPWCIWKEEVGEPLEISGSLNSLEHMVIVAEARIKDISSSQAHVLVTDSLLYPGRGERAEARASELIKSLRAGDWQRCFELAWAEFWDMHALFETARSPFGYMTRDSMDVLQWARTYWKDHGDGPLVTMDAGPNVHFLFRQDQVEVYYRFLEEFKSRYQVMGSLL